MAINFVRGYDSMPSLEEIMKIGGVVIVDNAPPGGAGGSPSNYACLVGEFSDMTASYIVNQSGKAIVNLRPAFAGSPADFLDRFGPFDPTLGNFGAAMGNGRIAVVGKVWGAGMLICLPVPLCSTWCGRMWRELPTNQSATDPRPIVPLVAITVPAAMEFKKVTNRLRTGVRASFGSDAHFSAGVDGDVTAAAGAAATQKFTSKTGDFKGAADSTRLVTEGAILVVGKLDALGPLGKNAATYRVVAVTDGLTLIVEMLSGAQFNWVTGAALPWRIHPSRTADSGQGALGNATAYTVPSRPLDATIIAGTVMAPTLTPPKPTGSFWDALSGLGFGAHPTQDIAFTAAIQGPNPPNSPEMDAVYQNAIAALNGERPPQSLIGGVACARKSETIALSLRQHVLSSASSGHPRIAFLSPPVNVLTSLEATGPSYPGVDPLRDNNTARTWYYWPNCMSLPYTDAVGLRIATSDGQFTVDGKLDVTTDEYALALFTRLPPEESPGKQSEPVPSTFATIVDYARGTETPTLDTYITLKRRGICGIKIDTPPPNLYSAVTTSLTKGLEDQNRRAFADYLWVNFARIADPYKDETMTQDRQDSLISAVMEFLNSLGPIQPLSGVRPQRIFGYLLSKISSQDEQDQGVYKLKPDVKMLAVFKNIVFSVTAGPTVKIEEV